MSAHEPLARSNFTPLPGFAFAADHLAHPFQLLRHPLVRGDDFVEGVGNLALDPEMIAGHSHREIPASHRLQGMQQVL
jgi:hypothetical protein